jgi:hypothetical protein
LFSSAVLLGVQQGVLSAGFEKQDEVATVE